MSKKMLDLAVAQFTGFSVADKGGPDPLMESVESMGLTKKEWTQIRNDVEWLGQKHIAAIDDHFADKA